MGGIWFELGLSMWPNKPKNPFLPQLLASIVLGFAFFNITMWVCFGYGCFCAVAAIHFLGFKAIAKLVKEYQVPTLLLDEP